MKTKLLYTLTVIMTVIFLFNTLAYAASGRLKDTRTAAEGSELDTSDILVPKDTSGKTITRPYAYFKAMLTKKLLPQKITP